MNTMNLHADSNSTQSRSPSVDYLRVRSAIDALQRIFSHTDHDSLLMCLASNAGIDTVPGDGPIGLDDSSFLERFQVEQVLGTGGFGTVFLARDLRLGRQVAVKVFDMEVVTMERFESQFLFEARTMAELRHSGLVAIYDAGVDGALWYIVMEYVEGPSLAEWLATAQTGLPFPVATKIAAQLAEAVQYAHARGKLHCDIKPSNVLLEPSADHTAFPFVAKLSDFGLARHLDDKKAAISERIVGGTPRYMAPEQVAGKSDELTVATDVYGLGCVLFELLTGFAPFAGITSKDWWNVVGSMPIRVHARRADVPADLAAICDKCLRINPHERYATARDLQIDLLNFLAGKPVLARPLGPAYSLVRWVKLHPAVAGLGTALIACLIIGIVTVTNLYQRERAQRRLAESKRHVARQAVDDMYGTFSEDYLFHAPQMQLEYRRFVEKALTFYEAEAKELPDDERGLFGLQVALHRSANCLGWLGRHTEAVDQRRRCLAVIDTLVTKSPSDFDYAFARFHNLLYLANQRNDLLLFDDALQDAKQAEIEIMKLRQRFPDNYDVLEATVSTALTLGSIHGRLGRLRILSEYFERAERAARELESQFGEKRKTDLTIVNVLLTRAEIKSGEPPIFEKRLQYINESQRRLQKQLDRGDRRWIVREQLVNTYSRLAGLLIQQRHWSKAQIAIANGIKNQNELIRDYPHASTFRTNLDQFVRLSDVIARKQGKRDHADELDRLARKKLHTVLDELYEYLPSVGEQHLIQAATLKQTN
jgi:tetratricopeptide (TPR) repeat protein